MSAANFRQWVDSLSWSQLQEYSTVTFTTKRQEYDTLQTLLRSHAPPPPPLHPAVVRHVAAAVPVADDLPCQRTRRDRIERPRLFQFINNNNDGGSVVARKKRGADGTLYSVASTEAQRQADDSVLRQTVLVLQHVSTPQLRWQGTDAVAFWLASRGQFGRGAAKWRGVAGQQQRWFSLSFYLCHLFEQALMTCYLQQQHQQQRSPPRPFLLSAREVEWTLVKVLAECLQTDLREQQENMRDLLLYYFLEDSSSKDRLVLDRDGRLAISVLEVGPIWSVWEKAQQGLEEVVCRKAEQLLLQEMLQEEEDTKKSAVTRKRKKSKRRKKHKTAVATPPPPPLPPMEAYKTDPSVPEHDDYSSGDETPPTAKHQQEIQYPENDTTPRDRNRSIVVALSVLDEVMNEVFDQLGFVPDKDPFADNDDEVANKARQDCHDVLHASASLPLPKSDNVGFQEEDSPVVPRLIPPPDSSRSGEFSSGFFQQMENHVDFSDSDEWWRIGHVNPPAAVRTNFMSSPNPTALVRAHFPALVSLSEMVADGNKIEVLDETPAKTTRQLSTPTNVDTCDDDNSLAPPLTPSPKLSPILMSLSDLAEIQKKDPHVNQLEAIVDSSARSAASISALSLPEPSDLQPSSKAKRVVSVSSFRATDSPDRPAGEPRKQSTPWSVTGSAASLGDNGQRSRDDNDIKAKASAKRSTDVLSSYRCVASKISRSRDDDEINNNQGEPKSKTLSPRGHAVGKPPLRSSSYSKPPASVHSTPFSHVHIRSSAWKDKGSRDACAQSELTIDGQDDYQHWVHSQHGQKTDEEDYNVKDGSTTITSALSNRESGETALREERDTYRDMCLTLGAEVAKLQNMLASQRSTVCDPSAAYSSARFPPWHNQPVSSVSFHPDAMLPHFATATRARTLMAMSDAGRDHESFTSDDDMARNRHTSSATNVGSDASLDHNSGHCHRVIHTVAPTVRFQDPLPFQGMESRLTRDMMRFLDMNSTLLRRQDASKQSAIERMTRLVTTVWPRAQVKLYGSNVTGLSLPSSDLDFVVCLPAVHKNAVAVAPGALEGRNAINETSHKLLARTMKGESWVLPRSMKLIDRTAVPVIKVSTKDTRARTLQLDITFDSPGHLGLAAVELVSQVMDELPLLRPLVIVLKQFLTSRGLLTSYTGGLSSYGLFLLVARYLQEQPNSWGDVGSLLMGFLDFYGNNFDPRATGISVRHRLYFSRQATSVAHHNINMSPHAWRPLGLAGPPPMDQFFRRRNSFTDSNTTDATRGVAFAGPPSHTTGVRSSTHSTGRPDNNAAHNNAPEHVSSSSDVNMQYTLDPLLIEDPLNESNNVGRNAFRILSVLRAFSDAHRALVAALEWDLQSATGEMTDNTEYPLLKCLLQNEDVVFNDL